MVLFLCRDGFNALSSEPRLAALTVMKGSLVAIRSDIMKANKSHQCRYYAMQPSRLIQISRHLKIASKYNLT